MDMDSLETERWMPTIDQELCIPKLIDHIRYSFRQCEFNEVQENLMDREKEMKTRIENLERDCESFQVKARLLEKSHGITELQKYNFEEKLQKSQKECEDLKERITGLTKQLMESCNRAIIAEEKLCENSKMVKEKDELILELNGKINELEDKTFENEQLAGVQQLMLKGAEQEISDLRREKLAADQTIEELKLKQVEADEVVRKLKQTVEEMSQKMTEAASVVPSASNSASSRRIESPNIGRRDVAQSLTEEDGRNMARVSPVSGSNRPDFRCSSDQHNEGEDQQVSDSNAVIMLSDCEMPVGGKSVFGACSSRKVAGPLIASADVIEVCDSSDDEMMPSATSEASCGQRNKRNRAYNRQDSLVSKRKKCVVICDEENLPIGGKEHTSSSVHPVVDKIAPPFSSDRSSLPRPVERSRVASNDSDDESCSESDLQAILETVQSKAQ